MSNSSKNYDKSDEKSFEKGELLHLFIVMGVSGSGKSSIGQSLADELNFTFVEADDFHSQQAKDQMADNKPLNDDMRKPWVQAIVNKLYDLHEDQKNVVLAFSGLKMLHRNNLRKTPFICHFFYLDGDNKTLMDRLLQRKSHFFSPDLLGSQFEAMESPLNSETDISLIDVNNSLFTIVQQVFTIARHELKRIGFEKI